MKKHICVMLILLSLTVFSYGQVTPSDSTATITKDTTVKKKSPVDFGGFSTVSYEFYNYKTDDEANFRGRKPKHLTRLIANPTLSFGKYVNLSAQIMISSHATNVLTPVDQYRGQFDKWYGVFSQFESFSDFLDYVANPINRLGFNTDFKKQKFYVGTHYPRHTNLTQGNISIFGAGTELAFGDGFFLKANYGFSQAAIEQDTAFNIPGNYRRRMLAFRAGIGNENKTYLAFNFSRTKDLENSLENHPTLTKPKENLITSVDFGFKLWKRFKFRTEIAGAFVTENTRFFQDTTIFVSDAILDDIQEDFNSANAAFIPDLIELNPSSRFDIAGETELGLDFAKWGISTKALLIGPGYNSFGYAFFISDRAELTINPRFSLLNSRLNFTGSFGKRINGFSKKLEEYNFSVPTIPIAGNSVSIIGGNKITATTQDLIMANLSWQASESFSVDLGFSNFGIENNIENDTLKLFNISKNFSLTPVYTIQKESAYHIFMAMASYDIFEDLNVISGAINDNESKIAYISYTYSGLKKPLTLGLTLNRSDITSSQFSNSNNSVTLMGGYQFFDTKLALNLNVTGLQNLNEVDFEGIESSSADNTQFLFRLTGKYNLSKKTSFSMMAGNNQFYKSLTNTSSGTVASRFEEFNLLVSAMTRF